MAKATAWRDYVFASNLAWLPYVNTTATADETYATAESTAAATRTAAVATALASHDVTESQDLLDAIDILSTASGTPWSAQDENIFAAGDAFTDTVAPALRDQTITEANAHRDFEHTQAIATRVLQNSAAAAAAAHRLALATAERDRAIAESLAENEAAETIPIANFNQLNWDGPAQPTGGETGGGLGSSTSTPRTAVVPKPQSPVTPNRTVEPAEGVDAASGMTDPIPLPLDVVPADLRDVANEFFDRQKCTRSCLEGHHGPPPVVGAGLSLGKLLKPRPNLPIMSDDGGLKTQSQLESGFSL